MQIAKLVADRKVVGFRFAVEGCTFDLSFGAVKRAGFVVRPSIPKISLVASSNGLLVSEEELKSGNVVDDLSSSHGFLTQFLFKVQGVLPVYHTEELISLFALRDFLAKSAGVKLDVKPVNIVRAYSSASSDEASVQVFVHSGVVVSHAVFNGEDYIFTNAQGENVNHAVVGVVWEDELAYSSYIYAPELDKVFVLLNRAFSPLDFNAKLLDRLTEYTNEKYSPTASQSK